jgi:hypothetical protein
LETPAKTMTAGSRMHGDPIQFKSPVGTRDRTETRIALNTVSAIGKEEIIARRRLTLGEVLVHQLAGDHDFGFVKDFGLPNQTFDGGRIVPADMGTQFVSREALPGRCPR